MKSSQVLMALRGLPGQNKDRWQLNLREMEEKIGDHNDKWPRTCSYRCDPLAVDLPLSQLFLCLAPLSSPLRGTQGGGVVSTDTCWDLWGQCGLPPSPPSHPHGREGKHDPFPPG